MRKQIDLIRQGGRVNRYHAKLVVFPESVAEHSFYVAWLAWMYGAYTGAGPSSALLMACLQHDLPEAVTGDMPGPTKRLLGGEKFAEFEQKVLHDHDMFDVATVLTDAERELLRWCDNLSGYMKCRQETEMGNRYLMSTQLNYLRYLEDQIAATKYLKPEVLKRMMTSVEGETDVHA